MAVPAAVGPSGAGWWLTDLIREIHASSYGSYGADRVHAELVLDRGIRSGEGGGAARIP